MVLMSAVAAMILLSDFVSCHESMNINGSYIEPNHHDHHRHLHRHPRLGHDHHQYYDPHGRDNYSKSNNTKKMEGGAPRLDDSSCEVEICNVIVQDCPDGCFCCPMLLFVGQCFGGSCCHA